MDGDENEQIYQQYISHVTITHVFQPILTRENGKPIYGINISTKKKARKITSSYNSSSTDLWKIIQDSNSQFTC